MFKAALAFIPLLSGYIFVTTWFRTSFHIKRDNSQKVYFRAAFWGFWLFLLSFGIATYYRAELQPYLDFLNLWREQSVLTDGENLPINLMFWIVCLAITLMLGMLSGFALNWLTAVANTHFSFYFYGLYFLIKDKDQTFIGKLTRLQRELYQNAKMAEVELAINAFNSEFEIILLRALEHGSPVSITTNSKVYVGYVIGAIDAEPKRESLRILPAISGYREAETMKVIFTTYYASLYQKFNADPELSHLHPSLFEIVIPAAEIKSINLFDIKAYMAFQNANNTANPNQQELLL